MINKSPETLLLHSKKYTSMAERGWQTNIIWTLDHQQFCRSVASSEESSESVEDPGTGDQSADDDPLDEIPCCNEKPITRNLSNQIDKLANTDPASKPTAITRDQRKYNR